MKNKKILKLACVETFIFSLLVIFLFIPQNSRANYETLVFNWSYKINSPDEEALLGNLFDSIINRKIIQLPDSEKYDFYNMIINYKVDPDFKEKRSSFFSCGILKNKQKAYPLFQASLTYRGPSLENQIIKLKPFHAESRKECLLLKKKLSEISWKGIYEREWVDAYNYARYIKAAPQFLYECHGKKLYGLFMLDFYRN